MMKPAIHYAHGSASVDPDRWHRLSAHLEGTGERAAAFREPVGCTDFGHAVGLLHDLGKYTQAFQKRLAGGRNRVDHSTAGSQVAIERYGPLIGKMLAFCIAGHHAGLANGVNGGRTSALEDRLRATIPAPDSIWKEEITLPARLLPPAIKPRDKETVGFCAAFFTRMVFSALVDADYLDTEAWYAEQEGIPKPRGQHPELAERLQRLNAHLDVLAGESSDTEINKLRREALAHARSMAGESPGLFTLTVPTGGGKTLTGVDPL